ncbi:MAG: class I SAM-dependent methyltransferase [Candidatus Methanoperedens sp.]|nr:class I SAM-dependent methyltransferase [Candidatus Methanoperedens sp.]
MKQAVKVRSRLFIHASKGLIKPEHKVLDVGCGDGFMTTEFKNHFKCNIVGTDVINYLKTDIPFVPMPSSTDLSFNDNEFDVVMIIDSLHNTRDDIHKKLLSECKRVGKTVLIFDTFPSFTSKLICFILSHANEKNMDVPLNFKSNIYYISMAKTMGFKHVEGLPIKKSFYYPMNHYGLLLTK